MEYFSFVHPNKFKKRETVLKNAVYMWKKNSARNFFEPILSLAAKYLTRIYFFQVCGASIPNTNSTIVSPSAVVCTCDSSSSSSPLTSPSSSSSASASVGWTLTPSHYWSEVVSCHWASFPPPPPAAYAAVAAAYAAVFLFGIADNLVFLYRCYR